jgi:murein DD-endopeptidase MepM/ murein hydrolase activator NlpD
MLAPHRRDAETHLGTVMGLAAALQAQWPIRDRGVHAPMPGRVLFAGTDGARGRCVVLAHTSDLSTELCFLETLEVKAGDRVELGEKLGTAEPGNARFGLRVGRRLLDPAVLKPTDEER